MKNRILGIVSLIFLIGSMGCQSKSPEPVSLDAIKATIEEIIQEQDRAEKVNNYFVSSYEAIQSWKQDDKELGSRFIGVLSQYETGSEDLRPLFDEWKKKKTDLVNKVRDNIFAARAQTTESEWRELMKGKLRSLQ